MKTIATCVFGLLVALALGCSEDGETGAPCMSDLDCKGERICLGNGTCSSPGGDGGGESCYPPNPFTSTAEYCGWVFDLHEAALATDPGADDPLEVSRAECPAALSSELESDRACWEEIFDCLMGLDHCPTNYDLVDRPNLGACHSDNLPSC